MHCTTTLGLILSRRTNTSAGTLYTSIRYHRSTRRSSTAELTVIWSFNAEQNTATTRFRFTGTNTGFQYYCRRDAHIYSYANRAQRQLRLSPGTNTNSYTRDLDSKPSGIESKNRTALATRAKLELARTAQTVNKEHNVWRQWSHTSCPKSEHPHPPPILDTMLDRTSSFSTNLTFSPFLVWY